MDIEICETCELGESDELLDELVAETNQDSCMHPFREKDSFIWPEFGSSGHPWFC